MRTPPQIIIQLKPAKHLQTSKITAGGQAAMTAITYTSGDSCAAKNSSLSGITFMGGLSLAPA